MHTPCTSEEYRMKKLFGLLENPEPHAPDTTPFWDDPHISKSMLAAHLNKSVDAASRTDDFMNASVTFIFNTAPPDTYPAVLDLGCGPGLYASKMSKEGYKVTGIDYSKRSINHARKIDKTSDFHYMNYLKMDYQEQFDLVILIYCDYGALSPDDRKQLLKKIKKALRPGGMLIFDVFTPKHFKHRKKKNEWFYEESGFFKNEPYLCLESYVPYPGDLHLEHYILMTQSGACDAIRNWHQAFTKACLKEEIESAGLKIQSFFADVKGTEFFPESKTLCAVVRK